MNRIKLLAVSIAFLLTSVLVVQKTDAQTLPYFAWGKNAGYTAASGDYEGRGIGFPVGLHRMMGNVVSDGVFFPEPGIFFEGTFEGTQADIFEGKKLPQYIHPSRIFVGGFWQVLASRGQRVDTSDA